MSILSKQICPTCGRTVMMHNGIAHDPVAGLVLTRGTAEARVEDRLAYLPHECRDTDIETYQARADEVIARLEAMRESADHPWSQADYVDAQTIASGTVEQLKSLIASHALDLVCPKCGADIAAPCENLTERRRGNTVPTKAPHEERMPPAHTVAGRDIAALREQLGAQQSLVTQIYTALETDQAIEKLLRLARQH